MLALAVQAYAPNHSSLGSKDRIVAAADHQASAKVIETRLKDKVESERAMSHRKRHTHIHIYHISCTHVPYTSSHIHTYVTHSHPHTIPHTYTHAQMCIQSHDPEHSRSQASLHWLSSLERTDFLSKRFISLAKRTGSSGPATLKAGLWCEARGSLLRTT